MPFPLTISKAIADYKNTISYKIGRRNSKFVQDLDELLKKKDEEKALYVCKCYLDNENTIIAESPSEKVANAITAHFIDNLKLARILKNTNLLTGNNLDDLDADKHYKTIKKLNGHGILNQENVDILKNNVRYDFAAKIYLAQQKSIKSPAEKLILRIAILDMLDNNNLLKK